MPGQITHTYSQAQPCVAPCAYTWRSPGAHTEFTVIMVLIAIMVLWLINNLRGPIIKLKRDKRWYE